jgi:hydrogenase maturation protein HypF
VSLAEVTGRVAQAAGLPRVVLTGGCFQNRLLLSLVRQQLERAGLTVYSHSLVPPNDGGLSLGQAVVAAHSVSREA